MDMYKNYKDSVNEVLPGIPVIIDKFHVIKELNEELEDIRKSLRKDQEKDERVSLKNMRFLMLTGAENLTKAQYKALNEIFEAYPQFEDPYLLKLAIIYLLNKRFKKIIRLDNISKMGYGHFCYCLPVIRIV